MVIISYPLLLFTLFAIIRNTFCVQCGVRYSSKHRAKRDRASDLFEPGSISVSKKHALGRIVGGKPAKSGDFPWLVSIQRDESHFCGGSILNPNWILSASHCFKDHETELDGLTVTTGANDYIDGDKYVVKEIITHEKFQFSHYNSDVSLLHLATPIKYSSGHNGVGAVGPICMPKENSDYEGSATVAGWGFLSNGAGVASRKLMAVDVDILDPDPCVDAYQIFNENTMLCAGYVQGKRDACQGDSGGPLVAILNGRAVQIGIVSYGEGCALRAKPGVYTKLTEFLEWIDTQINQREGK